MFGNLKKSLKKLVFLPEDDFEVEGTKAPEVKKKVTPKSPTKKSPPSAKPKAKTTTLVKKPAAKPLVKKSTTIQKKTEVKPKLNKVTIAPPLYIPPEPEKVSEPEPVPDPEPFSEPEFIEPESIIEPEPEIEPEQTSEPEIISEPEVEPEPKKESSTVLKKSKKALKSLFFMAEPDEDETELDQKAKDMLVPESSYYYLVSQVTHKRLNETDVTDLLWELELSLLENDVAKEVTEKIVEETKKRLLGNMTERRSIEEVLSESLKESIETILTVETPDIFKLIKEKQDGPYIIMFFGFNGTGKTLTIGKFAKLLLDKGFSVVMAAGDTFRAAAIEQLEVHAQKVGVPIIKQTRGSDAAAVIFDAIAHAKSKGINVVLADTAGRGATNANLMDELKKIVRVNTPDLKIFVGDSLTGNDAADQARGFDEAVGIDASVLTKVDVDAKGGSCLSVTYITQKPILYVGTGQDYPDMEEFNPEWFLGKVF